MMICCEMAVKIMGM